jgi:type I restriction enzyme, S subunit
LSPQAPLPHDWRWVALDEVCIRGTGTRDPRKEPEVPFHYVDISSVDNRRKVITEARPLLGKEAPSRARQVIRTNEVLVATTRPNLNAVALVPPELDNEICSTGFCVLRSNGEIDPEYLFAFVQTGAFVRSLSDIVQGALYPAVTDGQVRAQRLPLPPLPEQRRIAARLREQLSAVAEARAAVQAQINAAQALPAAHLRSVFSDSVARDWPRQAVADVCQLLPSKSIALAGDTEVRAITSACLTETGFNPVGVKTARMWKADAQESVVQPGEILIARSNTPDLVGRVSIYTGGPQGVVASDLTIRLWPGTQIRNEFLVGYLSFLYTSGYWRERAGGASGTMKKITRSQIEEERVPVPSASVQESVAGRLKTELPTALDIERLLEERLAALDHLPAALLCEAFSGRL